MVAYTADLFAKALPDVNNELGEFAEDETVVARQSKWTYLGVHWPKTTHPVRISALVKKRWYVTLAILPISQEIYRKKEAQAQHDALVAAFSAKRLETIAYQDMICTPVTYRNKKA